MYSRAGTLLDLPESYEDNFSYGLLDGEIWYSAAGTLGNTNIMLERFGRGNFPDSQRIVQADFNSINWVFLRYFIWYRRIYLLIVNLELHFSTTLWCPIFHSRPVTTIY